MNTENQAPSENKEPNSFSEAIEVSENSANNVPEENVSMQVVAADSTKSIYIKEITLPVSGLKAGMLPAKGKHMREAQKWSKTDETLLNYALIAQVVEVDGKKISAYDVDEMDLRDASALLALLGENFS